MHRDAHRARAFTRLTVAIVDLGRDGYARALRGESDPLPSFVGAPTFATADKELEWLNRAQCIVVGRVDMKALRVEYDAYAIEVGTSKQPIAKPTSGPGSFGPEIVIARRRRHFRCYCGNER